MHHALFVSVVNDTGRALHFIVAVLHFFSRSMCNEEWKEDDHLGVDLFHDKQTFTLVLKCGQKALEEKNRTVRDFEAHR